MDFINNTDLLQINLAEAFLCEGKKVIYISSIYLKLLRTDDTLSASASVRT